MARGYFRYKHSECFDCGKGPLRGQDLELRKFQIGKGRHGLIALCQKCAERHGFSWEHGIFASLSILAR